MQQLVDVNVYKLAILSSVQEPDLNYSIADYSSSGLEPFELVATWDFPIFELEERAGEHILSHVRYLHLPRTTCPGF